MAPMALDIQVAAPPFEPYRSLPRNRSDWTSDARNSYREVLGELEAWSRLNDSSRSLNSWIAEEAVRRSW